MSVWRKLPVSASGIIIAGLLLAGGAFGDDLKPCTVDPALNLTAHDTQRLEGLLQSRQRALEANEQDDDPVIGKALAGIYDSGMVALSAAAPGNYRCRTIKIGSQGDGPPTSVVYGYFACKIATAPGGWSIAKTTGSQDFTGTLTLAGDGLAYKGASHYDYEPPRKYGDDADENQVGCMYGIADNPRHYVLELPFPALESLHDLIELVPTK